VTAGAFQTTLPMPGRGTTSFVAKLNPTGSGLAHATYLGGPFNLSANCFCDAAAAVAIDSTGSAYVAGVTDASGFPVTQGAVQTTLGSSAGASNAYDRRPFLQRPFAATLNNPQSGTMHDSCSGCCCLVVQAVRRRRAK
jgi:hypothetical protein